MSDNFFNNRRVNPSVSSGYLISYKLKFYTMKQTFTLLIALLFSFAALAQDGYKVGDTAEDFKLKNVDGQMVSMSDYDDAKGFIVIFTCNHCPYSKLYEDRIKNSRKKAIRSLQLIPTIRKCSPKTLMKK